MEYYLYIKVAHIVGIVSWMAMLFYLPRLFVYHAQYVEKGEFVEVVKIQEKKLFWYIGLPALILTLATGSAMIVLNPTLFSVKDSGLWLHIKFMLVMGLVGYHIACGYFISSLASGKCKKSHKFFRIFNEIPTLALIAIALLAVCKPF